MESRAETTREGLLAKFNHGTIAIITRQCTEVGSFPFEEDWGVSFRLEENHEEENEA